MSNIKKINIAVMTKDFVEWGGGIDFLKTLINALILKKEKYNLLIFIPLKSKHYNLPPAIEKNIRSFLKFIDKFSFAQKIHKKNMFIEFKNTVKFVFYHDYSLFDKLKNNKVDIIFPSTHVFDKKSPFVWIGYLFDCQHKYLTDFFNPDEVENRDNLFSSILNNAKYTIVNSIAAKEDYIKFYGAAENLIFNLPFAPLLQKNWLRNDEKIKQKYNLPDKYFIISNQFWLHKDHLTAFKSLKILLDKGYENIKILCTGKQEDNRDPEHINRLKAYIKNNYLTNNIKFLGYLDKYDQIAIMKNALAVIYNAVALGIPAIVSDIPVNLEINQKDNIIFFKAKDSEDLAKKMISLVKGDFSFKKCTDEMLLKNSKNNLEILSDKIESIINKAVESR